MGATERRHKILQLLCRRRHETIYNLASEFGVSEKTIYRDITILSLSYPIYTKQGRYGGGVYIMDDYFLERFYMSNEEIEVLKKILLNTSNEEKTYTEREKSILKNIISTYSKPKSKKGNYYE